MPPTSEPGSTSTPAPWEIAYPIRDALRRCEALIAAIRRCRPPRGGVGGGADLSWARLSANFAVSTLASTLRHVQSAVADRSTI